MAAAVSVTMLVGLLAAPAAAQVPSLPGDGGDAGDVDGQYRGFGDPGGFHAIVPPGQHGVVTVTEGAQNQLDQSVPEHFQDQLDMYDSLILDDFTPGFTADDLDEVFKDGSFGVPEDDIGRTYSPGGRDDVVVIRDESFGIPHIYGETREGAMFANGYTTAEDKLFLMDVLRRYGRAELSAFLGASPANLAMDAMQLRDAPYTDADLEAQIQALADSDDPDEQRVFEDGTDYVAGVNQYISEALLDEGKLPIEYPALQQLPEEFVPSDIVAIASLVGGIFGKGGGAEVANFCGIDQMADTLGSDEQARAVFDDLKFGDDPDAPVTAPGDFPYMSDLGPVDPASVPDLDCDSIEPITAPAPSPTNLAVEDLVPVPPLPSPQSTDGTTPVIDLPFGQMDLDLDFGMSNALLVGGDRTDTGNPLAVFGPQTAYFVPQLLTEKDIHAPGIDARGVAFAGTDVYVQLGRGRDYAFSATSSSGDLVDQWVVELCEPDGGAATTDSMGYLVGDDCRDIEAFTETFVAKPTAAGVPESPEDLLVVKHFERTADYGPLTARGTLTDGTPIAVAQQRSTYQQELRSAVGFGQVNDPAFMTDGVESFRQAMGAGIDFSFNWFYVDDTDIGFQHSCLCPQRAQGTDPYLPTWGNGQWDWTGDFLSVDENPHVVNPPQGYLSSWNNKQADGHLANDDGFAYGPYHRSLMIDRRIDAELDEGEVDVGEAVDVMALAGTTDLRGQEIVPLLEELLGDTAPADADARVQDMWDRLRAWHDDDLGHRRDHDGDGSYERAQAVAIMDALWTPLFDAVLAEQSADARDAIGFGIHDAPQNGQGSAFNGGGYGQLGKALEQALGRDLALPFSREYCGAGDLDACVADVWDAFDTAAADLEAEFGSAAVEDWQRQVADDAITHQALGLVGVPPIDWQNRPTYQQVVQVPTAASAPDDGAGDDSDDDAPVAAPDGGGSLAATGGGAAAFGLVLLAGAVATRRRSPDTD